MWTEENEREFKEHISKLNDDELIKIVCEDYDDYREEALQWSGAAEDTGSADALLPSAGTTAGGMWSLIMGTTCSLTTGTTTVAATVATIPVVAAAAAATPITLAVVAAAAFMAMTRPRARTPDDRGRRAIVSPRRTLCIVATTTGSSTSSSGSAGPRARWISERTSRYQGGASGSPRQ